MLTLIPILVIANMIFILLLKLLTVQMEILA
ncbi:hypothetical protein J2Y45_004173 [Dyadobacter sp. BE34]|uniref:Uncharacterized protein n=1 Tax=Dyadobacter fermentans TaxID=94254 RepID=A0ABU1QXP7_9BACT|nr:hypothetical protein [Dyadobacter fermentans]MDR7199030.1 hypothetical protein [Dyadobacter sp. BE34]MDR7215947.1 hypothetical protein [Dyadobacter sp. BE31]MDR7264923.1 hypothetical protein [Dyadobacter sp. BE32]